MNDSMEPCVIKPWFEKLGIEGRGSQQSEGITKKTRDDWSCNLL